MTRGEVRLWTAGTSAQVTEPCVDWSATEQMIKSLAQAVQRRRTAAGKKRGRE